ncbi:MAG: UvrD-helicase domain-containing protein [Neisseriaceae bacterium]
MSAKLNQPQQAAIAYLDGPLLVLAGAGSGKTRVITHKVAHLINDMGYQAHHIAAITFTNKAAKEMGERLSAILPKASLKGLTVCTFHALGMKILREEAAHVDYKSKFSVLDGTDAQKILVELIQTTGKEVLFNAQGQISKWKNELINPEQALILAENEWERQMAQAYASYQDTLRAYQAFDFDDLIKIPTELLRDNAIIRSKWQSRLRYMLIDEYQDTNTCQYELVKLLAGDQGLFTAVGDDDQSIYAWRGANVENLRLLQTDFPSLKVIKLEQNYRSTARILKAANQVIKNNPDKLFEKKLWSEFGMGEMIDVIACTSEDHEAEVVVSRLLRHKTLHNKLFQDYAILYRGNHQARIFEQALRNQRVPYQLSGGQSYFDKAEIKDVLAYVRLLQNPDDDPAFIRALTTPKRGVGNTSLEKLNHYAKAHNFSLYEAAQLPEAIDALGKAPAESVLAFMDLLRDTTRAAERGNAGDVLQKLLLQIDYENHLYRTEELKPAEIKWRNVQDLCAWLGRKSDEDDKSLIDLAQTMALMSLLEGQSEEEQDAIRLSTLHASKGLEYPHVYLIGCEEGILPHAESQEPGKIEEERRLMYVGITRAKSTLTVSYCVKRRRAGTWHFPQPSRFIAEMPQEDLMIYGRKGSAPIVSKEEGKARLSGLRDMLAKK